MPQEMEIDRIHFVRLLSHTHTKFTEKLITKVRIAGRFKKFADRKKLISSGQLHRSFCFRRTNTEEKLLELIIIAKTWLPLPWNWGEHAVFWSCSWIPSVNQAFRWKNWFHLYVRISLSHSDRGVYLLQLLEKVDAWGQLEMIEANLI